MKKYLIIFILIPTWLFSLIIKTPESTSSIGLDSLQLPLKKITTERVNQGETSKEIWEGVAIEKIIAASAYDEIILRSFDGYMIRLTKKQIEDNHVILAIGKDGENREEAKWRLVSPTLREMYWIRGVEEIELVKQAFNLLPNTIYLAENYIDHIGIRDSLPGNGKAEGIYFSNLYPDVFPILEGEFTFLTKDGIIKKYNYNRYLEKAVIIKADSAYSLKSPDMPGGMWLKFLAYIQHDKRAIIFRDQVESWEKLATSLEWNKVPKNISYEPFGGSHQLNKLKDEEWDDILYFYW